LCLAQNQSLSVYGNVAAEPPPPAAAGPTDSADVNRVRQLRSLYAPASELALPLGLGDYLSLLFHLDEQCRLIQERGELDPLPLRRSWYLACCTALLDALALTDTSFNTLAAEKPYDPRQIVGGLRRALRERHGVFQAVYYEIAIGGLLRQRADILRAGRSVTHLEGGPGSGIADEALRVRIQQVYFTRFDEALLDFSLQLLDMDRLLGDLLPIAVPSPVELARLRAEYNYPDRSDLRWTAAFSV
jgi:hypothetical protein